VAGAQNDSKPGVPVRFMDADEANAAPVQYGTRENPLGSVHPKLTIRFQYAG